MKKLGLLDLEVSIGAAPKNLTLLGPVTVAAVSEAIRKDTGIVSWVHWPDLVTIDGKAVGRALVSPSRSALAVVIGATVNCSCPASEVAFSPTIPSTSILGELGVEIDVDLLREKVLEAIDWYSAEWERGAHGKLVSRIEPSIPWMGATVRVAMAKGARLEGRAAALDESGSLLLEGAGVQTWSATLSPSEVECVLPVRQSPTKRTLL